MTIWKERRWTTTDNKAIEITVWYHKPDGLTITDFMVCRRIRLRLSMASSVLDVIQDIK